MNTTTMKQVVIIAIVALSFGVVDSIITKLYCNHLAIKHHAAFYESNSWGIPSFHWSDDSYAHTPFQDEDWQKVSHAMFEKKVEQINKSVTQ